MAPGFRRGPRRTPLKSSKFKIGIAAVVALVVLRVSIGFHFFYEGVWKITNPDKFSAEPFLEMAKGPLKPVFDMMIMDKDGSERLAIEVKASAEPLIKKWRAIYDTGLKDIRYVMDERKGESVANSQDAVQKFNVLVLPILWKAEDQLKSTIAENESQLLELLDPAYEAEDADAKRAELAAQLGAEIATIETEMFDAINKAAAEESSSTISHALREMQKKLSPSIAVTEVAGGEAPKNDAAVAPGVKIGADYQFIDNLGTVINSRSESLSLGLPIYDEDGKSVAAVGGKLTGTGGKTLVVIGQICPGELHQEMIDRIWKDAYGKFRLGDASLFDGNAEAAEIQRVEAERLTRRYKDEIDGYLGENMVDILRYFGSLRRYEEAVDKADNVAEHQKERNWTQQGELYSEVKGWIKALNGAVSNYSDTFYEIVLTDAQRELGDMHEDFTFNDFLTLMLTVSLTAIGFCLIIGAFSRPAAIGGACFMCFVVASQPNWPSIYPPSPAVTGHALLINKDFIELVALLVVAAVGAGRWGGFDGLIEPFCMKGMKYCPRKCRGVCERVLGWFGLWCEEKK